MLCPDCEREGRHHPWCLNCTMGDGSSFADLLTDPVDMPWAMDPPDWVMGECLDSSMTELPELDITDGEMCDNEAANLQLLSNVATIVAVPAVPLFEPMDLINGVHLECSEDNDELSTLAVDKDVFERSRSPNELVGPVGPNSPTEGIDADVDRNLENLMKSARELASALSAYNGPLSRVENYVQQNVASPHPKENGTSSMGRCQDCSANGPCTRDICSIAPEVMLTEPPQSPDYESEKECWSDSSDTYRPIVSPISPAVNESEKSEVAKSSDYELGPSRAQKFWSSKMQRHGGRSQVKRIATIRPRTAWVRPRPIQGLLDPRRFRVTAQHPVLQTRAIVDRTIGADGSVYERTVNDQFVMSRTQATQTNMNCDEMVPEGSRDMATQTMDMHEVGCSCRQRNNGRMSRSMGTQTAMSYVQCLQTDSTDEEWEVISDEEGVNETEMEVKVEEENSEGAEDAGDASSDDNESSDSQSSSESESEGDTCSSEGTPVQDENEENGE